MTANENFQITNNIYKLKFLLALGLVSYQNLKYTNIMLI